MATKKRSVRKEVRTTVRLEEDEYKKLLREAVGAPQQAEVQINDGCTLYDDITVTWTEVVEEDE